MLYQVPSGSGVRYLNGLMELRGKGMEFDLTRERYFLRRILLQQLPQQFAQSPDHFISHARVFVNSRRDSVQRVKQKVRLELQAQILQLRFGEARFQSRLAQLVLTREADFVKKINQANSQPVKDEQVSELHRVAPRQVTVVIFEAKHGKQYSAQTSDQRCVNQRDRTNCQQMHENISSPTW